MIYLMEKENILGQPVNGTWVIMNTGFKKDGVNTIGQMVNIMREK